MVSPGPHPSPSTSLTTDGMPDQKSTARGLTSPLAIISGIRLEAFSHTSSIDRFGE